MRTVLAILLAVSTGWSADAATGGGECRLGALRCEYLQNPLGLDTARPQLSWIIESDQRGQRQTAYQVLVASSPELLAGDRGDFWDSGKVASDQSVLVEYAGTPLASGADCSWKVRIWDAADRVTAWSEPARFTVGLLAETDWKGRWIGMASAGDHEEPWFRKTFALKQKPRTALAYVASAGYHELYVNGRKVDDRLLCPSVSCLPKRALYVTYDIAEYLKPGENVVAVWLAPGWTLFEGVNPIGEFHPPKKPLLLAQFEIRQNGKDPSVVVSDGTWKCRLSSELHLGQWTYCDFGGDRIDATKELRGWNDVGLDDSAWEQATVVDFRRALSPDLVEPNRKCETIRPVGVVQTGPQKYQVDMGRFFAGWIEARLKGKPGSTISISHSYHKNVACQYNQRNEYVLGPSGQGTFSNHFAYHGCRYVTIEGLAEPPTLGDVTGYRIGNDLRRVGSFDCSNPLFKRIYDADLNTCLNLTTGGFMVDCPHRERLGYGDTCQTSLDAMVANCEAGAFYRKWARDWCDIQHQSGYVGHTAPTLDGGGGPCWSGSILLIPWGLFQSYGDKRTLETAYPSCKRWLTFLQSQCDADGLLKAFVPPGGTPFPQWCFIGDWLTPHGSENSDTVEALFFNNCYYLLATRTAARVARALGHSDDALNDEAAAERIAGALNRRFFNPAGNNYLDTRQSRYVMPLVAGAVPADRVAAVMANLRNEILVSQKGHLDVGDPVIYYMTRYLTEQDANDLVGTYLGQTTCPGYGFFVEQGFNTWPESWAAGEPEPSMIHGCFTGISSWFLRGLVGIRSDPASPGFKHFMVKPAPVGEVTWAKGQCHSAYGPIACQWALEAGRLRVTVDIPVNTTATVCVPASDLSAVTESGRPVGELSGLAAPRIENKYVICDLPSGHYEFLSTLTKP